MKSGIVTLLAAIFFSATAFAQEEKTMYVMKDGNIALEIPVSEIDSVLFHEPEFIIPDFVLINGVKWATCNVGKRGTFVSNPEDYGNYYTGGEAKTVCPSGWRLPTAQEQELLISSGSIWTTQNGVNGRLFGANTNTIFLPAAGVRYIDGSLNYADMKGSYLNSKNDRSFVFDLNFGNDNASISYNYPTHGLSVRCVVDETITVSVTDITLKKNTHTLTVNENYTLTADVMPADATDKTITWTSSDNTIATVDNSGKITAIAKGTATITAKAGDITAACEITVTVEGVVINGVKWAIRNVDAPGIFTANPEGAGMLYQWNRKIGWSTTDPMVNSNSDTTWDYSMPTGTTWEKANDPSPAGYRIPTSDEIDKLLDTDKVTNEWIIQNGVNGYKFTDIVTGNSIFLPAASIRNKYGMLSEVGSRGNYWSSTQDDSDSAYDLFFSSGGTSKYSNDRDYGFAVRPVTEN